MRKCTKCQQDKLEEDFYPNRSYCRKCFRIRHNMVICPDCGNKKNKNTKNCPICRQNSIAYITEKYCRKCEKTKKIEEFGIRIKRGEKVVRSRCKECEANFAKEYRKSIPIEIQKIRKQKQYKKEKESGKTKIYTKKRKLKSLKNIDNSNLDYYMDLVSNAQNCPICKREFGSSVVKCIDHNHDTNEFRGVICGDCNFGIGNFKDDVESMERAIIYLRSSAL